MRRLLALLLLSTAMFAGQPYATDKQIAKWTKRWQAKLNLKDWRITASLVPKSAISPDTLGRSDFNRENKTAVISVLRGEDYEGYSNDVYHDQELTVVHELVHIELLKLGFRADKQTEESVVVDISEALLGRREQKDTAPTI